jgi:hypothetical protein
MVGIVEKMLGRGRLVFFPQISQIEAQISLKMFHADSSLQKSATKGSVFY